MIMTMSWECKSKLVECYFKQLHFEYTLQANSCVASVTSEHYTANLVYIWRHHTMTSHDDLSETLSSGSYSYF